MYDKKFFYSYESQSDFLSFSLPGTCRRASRFILFSAARKPASTASEL